MKTSSKKMAAEISSALSTALTAKSSRKKIMKRIDSAAKRIAGKINKRMAAVPGSTKKNTAKEEKQAGKLVKQEKVKTPETAALA